jgi:hypothetical protein
MLAPHPRGASTTMATAIAPSPDPLRPTTTRARESLRQPERWALDRALDGTIPGPRLKFDASGVRALADELRGPQRKCA